MPSTFLFIIATLLVSLNFLRIWGYAISDWLYFGALGFSFFETLSIQRRYLSYWWRNRFLWMVGLLLVGALISQKFHKWISSVTVNFNRFLLLRYLFPDLIW